MTNKQPQTFRAICLLSCGLLAGCYNAGRLEDIGDVPNLNPIKDPTKLPDYHPVTMPMPEAQQDRAQVNSLWRSGARGFFKDQRAKKVGDILTVKVDISDEKAEFTQDTNNNRTATQKTAAPKVLGYETHFAKVLPEAVDPTNLVDVTSNPTMTGHGEVKRKEVLKFDLASTIIQILPNGNYVIQGRQEIRANFEVRELIVQGIVRPEDITSTNDIGLEKIAEARISYGGRGDQMDMQQAPLAHRLWNLISPF